MKLLFCAILAVGCYLPVTVEGDDSGVSIDAAKLIAQLGSDQYSERQAATRRLVGLGESAVPLLETAAKSSNREESTRAFLILARFFDGPDRDARDSAKAALEKLAEGDSKTAIRAANILSPPTAQANADRSDVQRRRFAPRIPAQNQFQWQMRGNFQFQFGVGRGGIKGTATKVQTQNINGIRKVTATENGRTVRIHDEPGKLTVEIKEDGKTEKFAAKNIDELRKKSPRAAGQYDKYVKPAAINAIIPARPLPVPEVEPER